MATGVFIIGLILFLALIVTHELGHFLVARRNGVVAEEFGIFFPPKLWGKKMKGGWEFTINLLPLGGFVKLKGEHDSDTEKGSFGVASDWAKTKIMLAGVGVNLVTALILFTTLALIGMPKVINNQFTIKSDTHIVKDNLYVGYIEDNSPAVKAGLKQMDQLLSIGTSARMVSVGGQQKLSNVTKQFAGEQVRIRYERNGTDYVTHATLLSAATVASSEKTKNPKGYLGVVSQEIVLRRSTWSAPIVAVGLSTQITSLTFQGLWHALQGLGGIIAGGVTGNAGARQRGQTKATSEVSGPLGIYFVLKDGSALGATFMLFIIALISLTLAIMNILPIPALDGGRLYLMLSSRFTKARRLTPKLEERIVGASMALLFGLVILITIVDVKRFY